MMKKSLFSLFICLFTSLLFSFSLNAIQPKPWTFLVYLAAANNLNEFADRDLAEMMKMGSNDHINVIVYLTVQHEGQSKITKRLYIQKGWMQEFGTTMPMDSGDVNTLMDALSWAHTDFPSEHIAVVLWNHGSGPLNRGRNPLSLRGICYDDDTNNYLTDLDCHKAFSWARDELRGGKKFDIIACDACYMAGIEIAHSFEPCADYCVAAQGTIPGNGYEYARVLSAFERRLLDPRSFARAMVEAYDDTYESDDDYTLSAIDLHRLSPLVANINRVSQLLVSGLKGKKRSRVLRVIKKCISGRKCPSFDDGIYIDLYQFYKNMRRGISKMKLPKKVRKTLKKEFKKGLRLMKRCIIANARSKGNKKARGLSIYFPNPISRIEPSYYDLYWTKRTDWLSFISAYTGK